MNAWLEDRRRRKNQNKGDKMKSGQFVRNPLRRVKSLLIRSDCVCVCFGGKKSIGWLEKFHILFSKSSFDKQRKVVALLRWRGMKGKCWANMPLRPGLVDGDFNSQHLTNWKLGFFSDKNRFEIPNWDPKVFCPSLKLNSRLTALFPKAVRQKMK